MKNNLLVGIFVFAGLVLFAVGLFLIGNSHNAFTKHLEFYTEYTNLSGLAKGAKVRVSGMEAGQVTDIQIPSSPNARFRVKLQVDDKLRGLIRSDSLTSIGTEGIVGDTYLLIKTGSGSAPAAADGSTLPSKEPFDLNAMLERGNGIITQADKTIRDADKTINQIGGDLHQTLETTDTTISNVDDVVGGIKQGKGAVGLLLRNQQFAGEVQQTLDNAKQSTVSIAHATGQADQMITDLQARNLPQKVDETMNNARSATAHLDATSRKLDQTLAEATAPDSNGNTAGANLRDTLSSANAATANLSEDTEALKHKFFFKGFFKKRGYYTLSDIDPGRYREDKVFNSPSNRRFWLPASSLFEAKADGTEALSIAGKAALESAVTENGGSLLSHPLIVEGYAAGGDSAAEVVLSRRRAILVSKYLEQRFLLPADNVGFVSLVHAAGTAHPEFNGVCVNFLIRHP